MEITPPTSLNPDASLPKQLISTIADRLPDPTPILNGAGESRLRATATRVIIPVAVFTLLAVTPAAGQSSGIAFCDTAMADTMRNIFNLIQYGGFLIGAVVALGATIGLSIMKSPDKKRELKQLRNQGLVYGVLISPMAATIIRFMLNNVVAGGASCSI